METIRLEVCIYENEYEMCVSFVLLHGVCLLSVCMECVSCPSAWCVCVVHMGYVVFTNGCMLIGHLYAHVICGI